MSTDEDPQYVLPTEAALLEILRRHLLELGSAVDEENVSIFDDWAAQQKLLLRAELDTQRIDHHESILRAFGDAAAARDLAVREKIAADERASAAQTTAEALRARADQADPHQQHL